MAAERKGGAKGSPGKRPARKDVPGTRTREAADLGDQGSTPNFEGSPGFRCGYVAIAGRPNVGKSTLMNQFLRQRLAIVTSKPQTTRRRTLGILNSDAYQIILLDTPGLMDPAYSLHRSMLREAKQALADADVILVLTEPGAAYELPPELQRVKAPCILVINKIDTVKAKSELIPMLEAWQQTGRFIELIPVSALEGDGVEELLGLVVGKLPEGPPFYPADQLTDQSERFFVAEIIRERIFEQYEKEVPYSTEVQVAEFKEREGAKDYIEAVIHVEHESQKAILIGRKGAAIRALGEDAREAVEAFLGRPVYLSLRVRVLPSWRPRFGPSPRFSSAARGSGRGPA